MTSKFPKRIFSGIQPTGELHVGNYFGAISNWVNLQNSAWNDKELPPIFSIVDLHAMTMPYDPKELRNNVLHMTASLLACGVDPEKSIFYTQSSVREHTELQWILSCVTPLGWLNRMTQFKDKSKGSDNPIQLGLLSYPVLQAADILLYKSTHVPVGNDQNQHLELSRQVANSFNVRYFPDDPFFPLPETLVSKVPRVMSLQDATKKMSKSDMKINSRLNLTDTADMIRAKIRTARTDSEHGFSIDWKSRPEKSNLLSLYAATCDLDIDEVVEKFANSDAIVFKADLTDVLVKKIVPIGDEIRRRINDPSHLESILRSGSDRARVLAQSNMRIVRETVGLT